MRDYRGDVIVHQAIIETADILGAVLVRLLFLNTRETPVDLPETESGHVVTAECCHEN